MIDMGQQLDNLRLRVKRLPAVIKDKAFEIACDVLLPISTYCKVCNILRGMGIGIVIGSITTAALIIYLGGM